MDNQLYHLLHQKYGSQAAIAKALGVDRSYLSRIKTEHVKPSYKLLVKAHSLVGLPMPWSTRTTNTMDIPSELIDWHIVGVGAK